MGDAEIGPANVKGTDDPLAMIPNLSTKPGNGGKELKLEENLAKNIIYKNVEQKPEFGSDINKYLANHINYPAPARTENIQGIVTLSFVLDENGNPNNIKIERDIGGGCGEEAKIVVSKMHWKHPARQNGHAVKMYYSLNVNFTLQ